jgi:putative flavoprotein involved in K+ transport
MRRTDTIIIGGGQAGLAMSRCLSDRNIDHVVLERGRVGERWRSERWDSARLLTPNWQSRLPDWYYRGNDPDGFMTMPQFVDYLEEYAKSFEAPIEESTSVLSVEPAGSGYRVVTNRGVWATPNVVIATGHCDVPHVPEMGKRLSADVTQLVPTRYRSPGQLPDGGVLVVGAAASGVQLADEIAASGRDVTLAVGSHVRLPRTYRGRDIMWWLETMGVFLETADEVYSVELARKLPSLQLVGRDDKRSLDLESLQDRGVRLAGRAVGATGHKIEFADDLADTTANADAKLERLVKRIDEFAEYMGLDDKVGAPEPVARFQPVPAPTEIDLRAEGISTVLWATGFRRSYPWLDVPVLDAEGEIRHDGGITEAPGLYVLGLRFLRRRNSSFIDGVGNDADELSRHLAARMTGSAPAAA